MKHSIENFFQNLGLRKSLLPLISFFALIPYAAVAHGPATKYNQAQDGVIKKNNKVVAHPQVASKTLATIDSNYRFENDLSDESSQYALTLHGDESYLQSENGMGLNMPGKRWIDLPLQLSQDIDRDQSFYISVDFMIPNTGIDESARVIVSNKTWDYSEPGFKVTAYNEKIEWQAEGMLFVDFNIGVGDTEIAARFYDIPMDEWHTVSVDVDFAEEVVSFGMNGRIYQQSLTANINGNTIDPSLFIDWLATRKIRVGAHYSPDGETPPWHYESEIDGGVNTTVTVADFVVDNLIIQSPKPPGDANIVRAALVSLTEHLQGTATLSEADQEQLLVSIRANLEGTNFADFSSEAKAFIDAHAQSNGSLYVIINRDNTDYSRYDDFTAISKAYVDLGVWMMKSGLTPANASAAENITFTEHSYFPGQLPNNAARIENGSAEVLAQYVLDPGYLMGGMQLNPNSELTSYVYRPTGFYAPAGETVTITVDPALVDSGLHIRVGGQHENHTLISSTNRFPLISVDYRIEAAEFDVINPFGGGIYVLVPQGTDLGWIDIGINNAVRAPYFSTKTGRETSLVEWNTIKQYPGLFAEFESDKFVITVPTSDIQNFDQPDVLLEKWDQIMDIFQVLHGRPLERVRAEGYMLDSASAVVGSYPGGYPVTPGFWAEGSNGITDGNYSPFGVLNSGDWAGGEEFAIMLHELGHHHYGRFINVGEQESFVNVPGAAVFNELFGLDYDEALAVSGYQKFSRADAAIDWMVTHNFRNGNPIGMDPTTDFEPIETSYQARGHAKFVDLADIFGGWEAIGTIYEKFYVQDTLSGTPADTQYGVSHDEFLLTGSDALQCNLASLFHFWGIHPSTDTANQLSAYPACDGALERVTSYLDQAPRTNEDLTLFHEEKTALGENQLKFQIYDQLLEDFDHSYGQQIRDAGAAILETYFGVQADQAPSAPVLQTASFNHKSSQTTEFSWSPAVDPEGHNLKYSWRLVDASTGTVLLFKSWLEGSSVTFNSTELSQALNSYENLDSSTTLIQEVTTSDLFTVVKSEQLESIYRKGNAVLRGEVLADFDYSVSSKTVNFSEQAVSANPRSYSWDFGDGNTSTQSNPSHTFADDGTYTVTLTVNDELDGSATTTKTITIDAETQTQPDESDGGGGSFGAWMLLAGLLFFRRR
ncbi:PKD domain-containing protein [Aliikangiella coralliicola]|uniref:PKD domain-containing protein n=1 Tax=Aliikangiella coralliicola TaxID=2592383 RepID=A0A545UF99_9GAMM|nr:PKD domain-containing protein [Aliikangiella coralliicola]TQV88063.1 PKD domain-containing protein [Aliikangiella coralliicola]